MNLSGRLLTRDSARFTVVLAALLHKEPQRIDLDCSGLHYIDSNAVATIVHKAAKFFAHHQGLICIRRPTRAVRQPFATAAITVPGLVIDSGELTAGS